MKILLLILFVIYSSVSFANRDFLMSDQIRTQDGKLVKQGDSKVLVLSRLGFPDMQQSGNFYYYINGDLYLIQFDKEKVSRITRNRE